MLIYVKMQTTTPNLSGCCILGNFDAVKVQHCIASTQNRDAKT